MKKLLFAIVVFIFHAVPANVSADTGFEACLNIKSTLQKNGVHVTCKYVPMENYPGEYFYNVEVLYATTEIMETLGAVIGAIVGADSSVPTKSYGFVIKMGTAIAAGELAVVRQCFKDYFGRDDSMLGACVFLSLKIEEL